MGENNTAFNCFTLPADRAQVLPSRFVLAAFGFRPLAGGELIRQWVHLWRWVQLVSVPLQG